MLSENESEYQQERIRRENLTVIIFVGLFIAIVLLTFCMLSVMVLSRQEEPRPTPQQAVPEILIPTASLPTAVPANPMSIRLPVILSGAEAVSVFEQIWKVTKIKKLGYELDGHRFDLATFMRLDSQETVKAYCMNRGWDIPEIGTAYLLTSEGIFVPLDEPEADPLQRFLRFNNK